MEVLRSGDFYFWAILFAFAALQAGMVWGGYLAHRRIDDLKSENLKKDKTIDELKGEVDKLKNTNPFRWLRSTGN